MDDDMLTFFVGLTVGMVVGAILLATLQNSSWKRDSIQRGFTEYNSTTGDWQWKTNLNFNLKPEK